MKNLLIAMTLLLAVACGGKGGSPTGPSNPPPPPVSTQVTLSGQVHALNGGQALPGVQAALGTTLVTTDDSGSFSASMAPTAALRLELTGASIVPRTLQVAMTASRPLQLDAIALGGQFDLNFYRQLVRNSMEGSFLQPLRRWTQNPNLYLQTSSLVSPQTLNLIESIARDVIPQWTNHQYAVGAVERGDQSRAGQDGWLTVLFAPDTAHCGLSDVGRSGGTVTFYPKALNCGCGGFAIRPTAIRHEFGHALGYYHTDSVNDLMYRQATQCDTGLSSREAYHASIAYNRPVGNSDPDQDPLSAVSLAPMRVIQ
jgi:hypothetical protein